MHLVSPSYYDVNTIGLVRIINDVAVMQYYRILTDYLQQKCSEKLPFDIAVHCILANDGKEEELILFNSIFLN